jgi:hypothetical protein
VSTFLSDRVSVMRKQSELSHSQQSRDCCPHLGSGRLYTVRVSIYTRELARRAYRTKLTILHAVELEIKVGECLEDQPDT